MSSLDSPRAPDFVWKFGYGSNISPQFLRLKKNLTVLDHKRCVLRGFALSFPQGKGIAYVEPSFASLRREPEGEVHGTCCLFPVEDAQRLDAQEGGYNVEECAVDLYQEDLISSSAGARAATTNGTLLVQVYAAKHAEAPGNPQGCCSKRYRDILVNGAKEMGLDRGWVEKLQNLETYAPSAETLATREKLPIFSPLPELEQWSIGELAQYSEMNLLEQRKQAAGQASEVGEQLPEDVTVYTSACGYIFRHKSRFRAHWGRDVTFRNLLHFRGINMEANDDGGVSPFPVLRQVGEEEPDALEYALQYRDRFHALEGPPVAALREFWVDQRKEAEA